LKRRKPNYNKMLRPNLEWLETRITPDTDLWTNASTDGLWMTGNNWTDLQTGQHHIPQGSDTAQFGGSNGSDANCTLTNPVAQTIQELALTAQYQGKLILNGADLAVSGNPFPGSQIDNPGGVVFDTNSDILDFRYGTAELSSAGGFSGARGNVWIEFGNQFTIQNTAVSSSTANFYVGGNSPSGMGSLVLNNTQEFGLKNGAYIQIMGNVTLDLK
jgi:hypothetical protein